MRRWAAFIVPFVVIFGLGLGAMAWSELGWSGGGGPPVVVASVHELDPVLHANVTVSGMAHYTAVVRQQAPPTLLHEARTWYLYGLFEPYDTESRAIRVLVRTTREPERLVSFELMTVTGRLVRATPDRVPYGIEVQMGKQSDYFFSDEVVLIEADDIGPYEGPPPDAP